MHKVATFILLAFAFTTVGAQSQTVTRICRGELDSTCDSLKAQYNWTERENCPADTAANTTCKTYCGKPLGDQCSIMIQHSSNGNKCGYTVFTVRCFN